jgi:hypothetical protein
MSGRGMLLVVAALGCGCKSKPRSVQTDTFALKVPAGFEIVADTALRDGRSTTEIAIRPNKLGEAFDPKNKRACAGAAEVHAASTRLKLVTNPGSECRWELAGEGERIVAAAVAIDRNRWTIECRFAPDDDERARGACEEVLRSFSSPTPGVETPTEFPRPTVYQTKAVSMPLPTGWDGLEAKYTKDSPFEAGMVSPSHRGHISVTAMPDKLLGGSCDEMAGSHAALDAVDNPTVSRFDRDGAPACRWQYAKQGSDVIVTAVAAQWLLLCVVEPADVAARAACDQVAAGFSVKR